MARRRAKVHAATFPAPTTLYVAWAFPRSRSCTLHDKGYGPIGTVRPDQKVVEAHAQNFVAHRAVPRKQEALDQPDDPEEYHADGGQHQDGGELAGDIEVGVATIMA